MLTCIIRHQHQGVCELQCHAGDTAGSVDCVAVLLCVGLECIATQLRRSSTGNLHLLTLLYASGQVPYSEHSSCAELQQFVQWFKPISIIPSVSNDGGSKLQAMLAAVTAPARPAAVQGPMDMFARPMQQRQRSKVVG